MTFNSTTAESEQDKGMPKAFLLKRKKVTRSDAEDSDEDSWNNESGKDKYLLNFFYSALYQGKRIFDGYGKPHSN